MDYIIGIILILFTILIYVYLNSRRTYKFWFNNNIPYLPPCFPFGNFTESLKNLHFAYISQNLYEKLKNLGDYAGVFVFLRPALLVTSPEFAKTILVRDFNIFMDRGVYFNKKHDPLSANLFFLESYEWKNLRKKLSPAFTSGKLKTMFFTITDIADTLIDFIEKNNDSNLIDAKDLLARYTTDVVSSCIFGIEGSCIKNPNSEFRRIGNSVMKFSKLRNVLVFVAMTCRKQARFLGLTTFNKNSTRFFNNLVRNTIQLRHGNNIRRNDLMQIMIDLLEKDTDNNHEVLTIDEISANAFIFFFAGFETSSTTLTFTLYNLALNPGIQNNVRHEIKSALDNLTGKFTYETITNMDLLERIILETLRLYPPVASLHRVANSDYILPNGAKISKGTNAIIPVFAMHHDSNVYSEPEKFDPERFTDEEKSKRHPFSFLPFGEGPRICIGTRLAFLQIKIALAYILSNFIVEATNITQIPIKIDQDALTIVPDGSVFLKFRKIST